MRVRPERAAGPGAGPVAGRRARPAAAALAAVAIGLAAPAGALGQGQPTDADLAASVQDLDLPTSIADIDVDDAVEDLETEERSGEATTVTVSSDVLFAFDSDRPSRAAERTIARLARRADGAVRVTGHTDSRGTDAYNERLSLRRARAVQGLLEDAGVDDVTARGRGEADPVAPNQRDGEDSPEGRAKNRRVEIRFAG